MGSWMQLILGAALVLLAIPLVGRIVGLGFGWRWFIVGVYHAFAPVRPDQEQFEEQCRRRRRRKERLLQMQNRRDRESRPQAVENEEQGAE
jgi:hypothetical protein